jgi:hypothetical protein
MVDDIKLSEDERFRFLLDALAQAFQTESTATPVLNRLLFPRGRRPRWTTAEQFWMTIIGELDNGIINLPYRRLLDEVRRVYPANPVFRQLATDGDPAYLHDADTVPVPGPAPATVRKEKPKPAKEEPPELADAVESLDRLETTFAEGRRLAEEALECFLDPEGLLELADPDCLSGSGRGLRPWLADLQDAARAGRDVEVARGIREWRQLAADTQQVADELVAANAAPMRYSSELRGRLTSYQAKAARLGLVEDRELSAVYSSARAVLVNVPIDLRLAERHVHAYEKEVNIRAERASGAGEEAGR